MEKSELFEKNNILNFGIILLALFAAFQIYRSGNDKINSLLRQRNDELKKNNVLGEIAGLEKKIEKYKKVFVKKDLGSVIDTVSGIAKKCSVNIISVKPGNEEMPTDYYIKTSFIITVNAANYHSLGDFISQLESYKDIYMVDEMSIILAASDRAIENINTGLMVNLKISTISYLNDEPDM